MRKWIKLRSLITSFEAVRRFYQWDIIRNITHTDCEYLYKFVVLRVRVKIARPKRRILYFDLFKYFYEYRNLPNNSSLRHFRLFSWALRTLRVWHQLSEAPCIQRERERKEKENRGPHVTRSPRIFGCRASKWRSRGTRCVDRSPLYSFFSTRRRPRCYCPWTRSTART